jgi:hypothetical protein
MLTSAVLLVLLAQAAPPPPPPPGSAQPRRDIVAPAAKGTAVIRGRVIAADGQRPLRRAQVRVLTSDGPAPHVASTNAQGVYEIRDLPAGRYRVTVTRSGYLSMQFGQRRPDEPATPLEIADGHVVENVNFAMLRAGVISGRVTDETGDAVAGVTVWAMQPRFYRGRRRFVPAGSSARTDDTGQYRLLALAPGDYVVMGLLRETWTTRGKEKITLAYAPSYFPTTARAADAQRVKVGVGQEVGAVDFSLVPGRTARLSGTATRADGAPLAGASVSLSQKIMGPAGGMMSSVGSTRAGADGAWTLRDVAPGEYELEAAGADSTQGERALMVVNVSGVDLDGISLVAGAAATIAGRVVTDDGRPLPGGWGLRRVGAESVVPDGPEPMYVTGDSNGLIGADGVFELAKVPPGRVMLRTFPPGNWAVARVEVGGQDVVDSPIDVRSGDRIDGVRIVITDRFPAVTGRIVDDKDQPAHGTVLFFPTDASKWLEAAGTMRTARPDQTGTFKIAAVRPGQYFAIALEYVPEWQVNDPEFLAGLRERATKITVGEAAPDALVLEVRK